MQRLEIKPHEEIKVVNVVCTADLKQRIDVSQFNKFGWGIYDLEIYGGRCGYVKTPEMQGRVTVFPSGKMISVGGKSIDSAKEQIFEAVFNMKQTKLIKNTNPEIIIQNIVATVDFGIHLNLKKLVGQLPHSTYKPEKFAGLIFKIKPRPTALIFESGSVVLVGSKSYEELNSAFFELKQRI